MNRSVNVCTEYQRNDIPFRCHPNYRSHGPWHDWALFKFHVTNEQNETWMRDYPCRIHGVLMPELNDIITETHMIVSACTDRMPDKDSVFLEQWSYDPDTYYCPSANSIVSPIFVLHNIGSDEIVVKVKSVDKWASEFVQTESTYVKEE